MPVPPFTRETLPDRVYRIEITDIESGERILHLQWLIDGSTLRFLISDLYYQLAIPDPSTGGAA